MTFLTRDYEPALVRFLASRLSGGGVFVDVGAHVGLVSLSVASRCRSVGVEVHAFEPDPRNAADFRKNLELNPGLKVVLNEVAVGSRRETVVLRRAGETERACASIVAAEAPEGEDEFRVETISLTAYAGQRGLSAIDVLKVDVEGYEQVVLDGAEELLAEGRIRWIVCELNDERLAAAGSSREELYRRLGRHGCLPGRIPNLGLRRVIPPGPRQDEDVPFHCGHSLDKPASSG